MNNYNGNKVYSADPAGYYAVLGVAVDADEKLLKLSYREQAKKWHPDHNKSSEAMEIFQKLSVAYDILSDENKRLTYDLAAASHPKENFPDIFALKILTNREGSNDVSVRALELWNIRGLLYKYLCEKKSYVCNFSEAEKLVLRNSLLNWLLGWWSPKSLFKTPAVLKANYREINQNRKDNFSLLVHNALAYQQENLLPEAYQSDAQAWEYASEHEKALLEKFMKSLPGNRAHQDSIWNFSRLKHIQLIVPAVLGLCLLLVLAGGGLHLVGKGIFSARDDSINYYQEVRHWRGSDGVDDVVVAKILDIRVDLNSLNMLYHIKPGTQSRVMYGPSDDFDVITVLKNRATVRVTGISPDKSWVRIMLDNGDMGFVHTQDLGEGIGAPIPHDSKIYTGIR